MTQDHPRQPQDPAGSSLRKEERNTFSFCSSSLTAKGGGAPVCGLLVLISGVCVLKGHFSFVFPFCVFGEKGSCRQQPPKQTVQFPPLPRPLGRQSPKGRTFKPQPQSEVISSRATLADSSVHSAFELGGRGEFQMNKRVG